ncbi:MAG TPA: orotate phosphoribosyltransferase [Gemmatimonadaceae bacterium]|jgi:orotate phosphoribosyltransferase|nr:orotate phosphoribosyltransferase [Gemmatimonadaceae bacterium]
MDKAQLAAAIANVATLRGEFRLRSGTLATDYFDKYRFESDPALLAGITEALVPLVPSGIDAFAGLELGGIPLATALSLRTGLPTLFVRKRAKGYGTCRLAEGGEVAGQRLVMVEDVVTSGGQVIASCEELRTLGGVVEHALCVIDREAGGREALQASGVELHALFRRRDLERMLGPV